MSDWYSRAACRGHDTTLWFPDKGWTVQAAKAKLICATCTVRPECFAAGVGELGIWGGKSERARRPDPSAPPRTGACQVCAAVVSERAGFCSSACRKTWTRRQRKGVA